MAQAPFVIIPSLTAIAVAYKQSNLIADGVLPRIPVQTQSFRYAKYALGDAFTAPETLVGRKGAPNQIDFSSTEETDTTQDHALDSPVPNADQQAWSMAKAAGGGYVSSADPQSRAAAQVSSLVMTRREKRAADLLTTLGNYAAANRSTLSGTSQWSDYINSDPLPVMMAAFDTMIMRPNIGFMSRLVATKLRMHPKVCKAVFGNNTDAGIVPLRALADQLELDEIYVGEAWINTAAKGQAPNVQRIWGKHAGFLHRNMQADTDFGITFGMTAQWGERVGGTVEDADIGMRGGVRVRVGESVKELITANDLGCFFQNAIA